MLVCGCCSSPPVAFLIRNLPESQDFSETRWTASTSHGTNVFGAKARRHYRSRPQSVVSGTRKIVRRTNPSSIYVLQQMQRSDGRGLDQIRSLNFELNVAPHASGSVLVSMGNTRVICAVTIEETVPRWMKEQGVTGGWLTAEYSMLPYSTQPRKPRDITKGRIDGRSIEIQRLIGRSLRAVIDLEKLGARTIWVDCDVLQADGGTRTAAITGAFVALCLATKKLVAEGKLTENPIRHAVAAVSVGVVK